jgi:hypothetical protein
MGDPFSQSETQAQERPTDANHTPVGNQNDIAVNRPGASTAKTSVALKARNNSPSIPDIAFIEFYCALQGNGHLFVAVSQGIALGWHVAALQAEAA